MQAGVPCKAIRTRRLFLAAPRLEWLSFPGGEPIFHLCCNLGNDRIDFAGLPFAHRGMVPDTFHLHHESGGGGVFVEIAPEDPFSDAPFQNARDPAFPEVVPLLSDAINCRVAFRPQGEFGNDNKERWILSNSAARPFKHLPQFVQCISRWLRNLRWWSSQPVHQKVHNTLDQCFFRGKVVVERGIVDTGARGDLLETQTLKPFGRDQIEGNLHELLTPVQLSVLVLVLQMRGNFLFL